MNDVVKRFAERWFSYDQYPDYKTIKRVDFQPISKQIRQVVAHLEAEVERLDIEDETNQAEAQRVADTEPRVAYRLRRVAPFGYHRDPVDCWSPFEGKVYYDFDNWGDRVVAGTIEVHATNRSGVPGMNLIGPMFTSVPPAFGPPLSCSCPTDATVIATERWAAEFTQAGWTLEPITTNEG